MPKAKWGTGDDALSAADIDGAERKEGFARYEGETPPPGIYRFVLKSLLKAESGNGNPKIRIISELDGSWKPKHKQYDGFALFDHLPIMKSTAGRVANFLDAIGATGKDLSLGTVVDEDGYITKLGSVGDPAGLLVYINCSKKPASNGYAEGLQVGFNGYLPVDEADEADEAPEADEDGADESGEDGDEPPF
jgi:hypothetical protein